MALNRANAVDAVRGILPEYLEEREHLNRLDRWYRGDHDKPFTPREANLEYKELARKAVTPYLSLIVTTVAQSLYVEGYRPPKAPDNVPTSWDAWERNGLDGRQSAIYRGALTFGRSYATVLPGDPVPAIRGVSARKMLAVYADPAEDEWPMLALRAQVSGDKLALRLYDEEAVYYLSADRDGGDVEFISYDVHGVGVCPVVRFCNLLDLDGRVTGEIGPMIPLQERIDQTVFDRLMAQTFGSWKVRTIAGLSAPDTTPQQGETADQAAQRVAEAKKLKLAQDRMLVAEDPDTKFGTLDETPLDGYINAKDADVHDLAAVSQTPPHHLLGQMANLSAEALAAAEAATMRKVEERKHSFGQSWQQTLRLAAHVAGDSAAADDASSRVVWRDMESRSLAQTADALGKLATMLGVPPQALWERIPGVTTSDVEAWRSMLENDPLTKLTQAIEAQSQGGAPTTPPPPRPPFGG